MEIFLSRTWDAPILPPYHNSLPPGDVDFIGRAKEIELLKNDILRKDQGSILVAGHRGVGKTSFVYKVLQLAKVEKDKESEFLYIYMNAGQLDSNGTEATDPITTESILKALIRRLYATTKDIFSSDRNTTTTSSEIFKVAGPAINARLDKLYRKAVAKEFKLEETVLNTNTTTASKEKSSKKEFSLDDLKISQLAPAISAISLVAGLGIFIFHPFAIDLLNKIVSFLLTLPIAITFTYSSLSSTKTEQQNQVKAQELYEIDNNMGNLEYDLEELHRLLHKSNIKIIYVIDELDKLTPEQIKKVLRYLKNLFTLSKAIFIFIGNEDLYDMASKEVDKDKFRPEYYTFFTSKYFIGRPTTDELQEYFFSRIDQAIDRKSLTFQRAAHYLAYESKGDLFNFVNTLKDSIIRYEGEGRPVVDIAINSPIILKKSRLHKSISVVFFQTYFSKTFSRMRENELLYRQLIDYMYQLKDQSPATVCGDPDTNDQLSSAKRDINRFLSGINFLNKNSEVSTKINGVDTIIASYTNTGTFNADPPDRMETLSENEKRLLALCNEYLGLLLPVINTSKVAAQENKIELKELSENIIALTKKGVTGIDLAYSSNWPEIFYDLQQELPVQDYGSEITETCINELTDAIIRIKSGGFSIFKAQILSWFNKNGYTEPPNAGRTNLVDIFRSTLLEAKIEWSNFFYVLPQPDSGQLTFLFGRYSPGLENVLEKLRGDVKFTQLVVLFIIQTSTDETEKLKQFSSTNNVHIEFVDLSSPDKLLESFEKTVSVIQTENKENTDLISRASQYERSNEDRRYKDGKGKMEIPE